MSTVALPSAGRVPGTIGQATAVEQSRAIAEVQAAVVVAQQCPRDMDRALGEMRDSCGRTALAQRAFYSVPNRGNGPSVHLAREIARIWGNIQYGVHELRRDDDAGESEVQAFAWDLQTNTRSTRTFVVPHARMKGGQRQKLTDLGDIYLSNQNVGARAVRECIFTVLPTWYSEEAQDLCRATLDKGDGKPIEQRVAEAVDGFAGIGVNRERLEAKIGRKRGQWTPADVAELAIAYTSITRDGVAADELFPAQRVNASDVTGQRPTGRQQPEQAVDERGEGGEPVGRTAITRIHAMLTERGITDRPTKLSIVADFLGHPVNSTNELTKLEASRLIDWLATTTTADFASEPGFTGPPPADGGAEPEGWRER
jgi:hypothetical protein